MRASFRLPTIRGHENVLRRWIRDWDTDPKKVLPGQGLMNPDQAELERMRREVTKLKAERDIQNIRGRVRVGSRLIFGFLAKHRAMWLVSCICYALRVSRSGLVVWVNRPPGARARCNEVVGASVRRSFLASDGTYGRRRGWRDVFGEGISCGLRRIERFMRCQVLRAHPPRRPIPVGTREP